MKAEQFSKNMVAGKLDNGLTFHIRPVWLNYPESKELTVNCTIYNCKGFTLESYTGNTSINTEIDFIRGSTALDNPILIGKSRIEFGEWVFEVCTNAIKVTHHTLSQETYFIKGEL